MLNSNSINKLNIALMLTSCLVALFLPLQLFLFAYAFLGPAHYLTEISWLHKRHFFTKGRHDYWLLGALASMAVAVALVPWSGSNSPELARLARITSTITCFAFGNAPVSFLPLKPSLAL